MFVATGEQTIIYLSSYQCTCVAHSCTLYVSCQTPLVDRGSFGLVNMTLSGVIQDFQVYFPNSFGHTVPSVEGYYFVDNNSPELGTFGIFEFFQ